MRPQTYTLSQIDTEAIVTSNGERLPQMLLQGLVGIEMVLI
jgi:hypothetical protein